ncbi:MAG TPA: GNAT family N-acetyltransferase [Actinomycetes bacterium]
MTVRRLAGVAELLTLADNDPYVAAEADPERVTATFAAEDGAVGWVLPSRRVAGRGHLVALGPHQAAVDLLVAALEGGAVDIGSVSLPRDADRLLPPPYSLDPRNDWEWYSTTHPPPVQAREPDVRPLADGDLGEVAALLAGWSPRADVAPGDPGVLGWCGVRDHAGSLVAAAAHTERRPGVPHLASIVTHGDHRGNGLGAAVTAWLTRRLLDAGSDVVTLGMYSDNDDARRVYRRLGFACAHELTSGRLVERR